MAEEEFTPWHNGKLRISELTIERLFGCLRTAQTNAELDVESFLRLSAFQTLREVRKKVQEPKQKKKAKEAPLSDEKLRSVCL